MALPFLNTIQTMIAGASAAIQSACSSISALGSGAPELAILQADASQWSFQQANIQYVLTCTRLSSCVGNDCDTFVGDYGMEREGARSSVGSVTALLATGCSGTILVGSTVQTEDGTQSYAVTASTTAAYWTASVGTAGGYVVPAGVASVTVPISAVTPGAAGNVPAGAISAFGTAIPGFLSVTNAAATTGGADTESDAALKIRFVGYIAGLQGATIAAVVNAVNGIEVGLTCFLQENVDPTGAFRQGYFTITVDDGSGYPAQSLLNAVIAAVNKVRPVTVEFAVVPPVVVAASIVLTLSVTGGGKAALVPLVATALTTYVNALSVGSALSLTRISAIAYGVSPANVANVSGVSINGAAQDLAAAPNQVIKVLVAPVIN